MITDVNPMDNIIRESLFKNIFKGGLHVNTEQDITDAIKIKSFG